MNNKTLLNNLKTDFELSLNDLFGFLEKLSVDNKNLKLKAFEPDKHMAKVFLEYLSWNDDRQKEKFEAVYTKELAFFNDWVTIYCQENKCSKEDALLRIIEK